MVPAPQARVRGGQTVTTRIEKISKHAEQIEIHEERAIAQQEGLADQHFFAGNEGLFQLGQQTFLVRLPLVQAAAAELALFMANEPDLVICRHYLLPVNIIQAETGAFNFALDIAPQDGLDALEFPRKQPQAQLGIQVFGDDLGFLADLEDNRLSVTNDRHAVIPLLREPPNQRTLSIGDIGNLESDAREFQDSALDNTKRTPGKLNQFNHVVLPNCATAIN